MRQPVHEVDVDAINPRGSERFRRLHHHVERLDASDRLLDGRGEILDAAARSVHAERGERVGQLTRHPPRVEFDRVFGGPREIERAGKLADDLGEQRLTEDRGRAAAPMEMHDAVSPARPPTSAISSLSRAA